MIEIKITGETIEEVTDALARTLGGISSAGTLEIDAKKVAETAKSKEDPEDDDTPSVTLAEIKTLAKAKMEEQKSKAIKGLLADLGIKKIDQLDEDQYADFYASLEEL
ncbi:hypothetical protein [Streptococcus cuniculi]|uniref:rRNA biogenesis protein rrp5 n=1 Tax=Streptococcus cuniculi TaxID=1432788 RepID=A0A4Y9JD93_9STRE|nr:hypothetical protein [Streptococcus cuniculi]MBF0778152.1 hypothetical protein [Streptococcus cuniculi]TFU97894.1 hypothetical protein E4T82_05365 [Streptococcus cuniculi]